MKLKPKTNEKTASSSHSALNRHSLHSNEPNESSASPKHTGELR